MNSISSRSRSSDCDVACDVTVSTGSMG